MSDFEHLEALVTHMELDLGELKKSLEKHKREFEEYKQDAANQFRGWFQRPEGRIGKLEEQVAALIAEKGEK